MTTFLRFGNPSIARPEEHDELLDRFIPVYDVVERLFRRARMVYTPDELDEHVNEHLLTNPTAMRSFGSRLTSSGEFIAMSPQNR